MPDCLNESEGMFPGHYDPCYDQTLNPFEPGHSDPFEDFLQSKALEILKIKLSPEKIEDVHGVLKNKGLMNKSFADPLVVKAVEGYLKRIKMAKRILCQI